MGEQQCGEEPVVSETNRIATSSGDVDGEVRRGCEAVDFLDEAYRPAVFDALGRAGANRDELIAAIRDAPGPHREGVAFLIANMPDRDLTSLGRALIRTNVELAYEARDKAPWGRDIPADIFLNDVLPCAHVNERRDDWRRDFVDRFAASTWAQGAPSQAALKLNQEVFDVLGVTYHATKRPKCDQSPYESTEAGFASCTGLSIILANACRAAGVDNETCASIAAFCYFQGKYFGKAYPSFVTQLQLFDSFKIDCGNGDCYQCCYRPNKGCHTSFKGEVVINCNPWLYGVGTRRAGDTFVLKPQPGKPCLYTPQTCEHIPLCWYNGTTNIGALEALLDKGTPHTLNLKGAKDNRARKLAESIVGKCYKYVNAYATDETSLEHLADTITGRGCKGWRTNVTKTWPMDPSVSAFEVKVKKTGKASLPASQVNWLVQLCAYRVISSFPNLRTRLDYTDSKVWTATSKSTYLAKVASVDKSLLTYASSHALAILKQPTEIQDYRLLGIPRPGEPSPGKVFNGCLLGTPPQVKLSYAKDGNVGVKVQITVADPEAPALTRDNPVTVLWGDGQASHGVAPGATKKLIISHAYQLGGKYIVWVVAANDSGLRGVTAIMVETTATAGVKAAPSTVPTLSRVVLEKVNVTEKSLSGNDFVYYLDFSLHNSLGKERQFGRSRALTVVLNKTTPFGDLAGHNTSGTYTKKVTIRPRGILGFAIGLSEMYFTTTKVRLDIFNTETGTFDSVSFYPLPKDVKVYPKGSSTPLPSSAIKLDAGGLVKFPFFAKVNNNWTATERIEIEITPAMFSQYKIGATSNTLAAGSTKAWIETSPGVLVPVPVCGNKVSESGEECDDGNTIEGDGCTSACKLEGTPGGVVNFTAQRGGIGVILSWKTSGLKNCKTFELLRCVGASCVGASTHKVLSSIGPVTCKYTTGGDAYQFLDMSAPALPQISYYLRQHGIASAYTDHGPAVVSAVPPDLGPPDSSPPDISVPDQTVPDQTLPDQAQPDQAQSDVTPADTATPDRAIQDVQTADTNQPNADLPVSPADGASVKGDSSVGKGGCSGCEVSAAGGPGALIWVLLGFFAVIARRRR